MLLASGANFGFVRTLPQVLGITVGFSLLLLSAGLGLGALLTTFPVVHTVMKIAGGAYLLYLAWRIAMARSFGSVADATGKPLTFVESAAFQWINPKAWIVAITTRAVYANPDSPFVSAAFVSLAFAAVNRLAADLVMSAAIDFAELQRRSEHFQDEH